MYKPSSDKLKRLFIGRTTVLLLLVGTGNQAWAQSALPGSVVQLEPVFVSGNAIEGSVLSERLSAIAGGVALIERKNLVQSANLTPSRALSVVPGVVIQNFFGANDQPRIQIRGSGLQQNPVERGILMLQDGLPLNRADGSYIVGFLNPGAAGALEVYRGYTANRLGANVLGGAINMISATGSNQPSFQAGVSGGSFGQIGSYATAGFQGDSFDALLRADLTKRDGFREYNSSQRSSLKANVGYAFSEQIKSRVFLGYTDVYFDTSGALAKAYLEADPRQNTAGPIPATGPFPPGVAKPSFTPPNPFYFPGPNVPRDKPAREAKQYLIGSRTTVDLGAHLFDVVLGYTYTDDTFRFPVSAGIRTTKGGDFTSVLRYALKPNENAILPLFETTVQYSIGSADRQNFHNLGGIKGAKFGDSKLDATTLSLNATLNLPLTEKLIVSPTIAYSYAIRKNDDRFFGTTRPTIAYAPMKPNVQLPIGTAPKQSSSYRRTYRGWLPSLAISFRPDDTQTFFAAVSRTFEPPTHDDLLATINGTFNSGPGRPAPPAAKSNASTFFTPKLKAQTATTLEAGWRNNQDNYALDATLYYSWLKNELINLRDSSGNLIGGRNAGKTSHFGVELGISANISEQLYAHLAYTYQDFRFQETMGFGGRSVNKGNKLGGAIRHVINTTLRYDITNDWTVQGNAHWLPSKTPVDNMNTLYNDAYAVFDLRTRYQINKHFSTFLEVTNIFNTKYAGSTLVIDQARPDLSAFLPGDGRGFFVGVDLKF